jgi:hypothetical protein
MFYIATKYSINSLISIANEVDGEWIRIYRFLIINISKKLKWPFCPFFYP